MIKGTRSQENIPKKVLGVENGIEGLSGLPISSSAKTTTSDSPASQSTGGFVNSYDVINDWEKFHGKIVKGKIRAIGEYVAKQNLSKKLPTNKEIRVHLMITKEYCKKILAKACRIGLLGTHEVRSGHQYRYYVTNIQDYVILDEYKSKSEVSDEEINLEKDLFLPLALFDDLRERENISFHHISLNSKLKDISDYDRLNWRIKSDSNKGKVFELKLSQYRSCVFIRSLA